MVVIEHDAQTGDPNGGRAMRLVEEINELVDFYEQHPLPDPLPAPDIPDAYQAPAWTKQCRSRVAAAEQSGEVIPIGEMVHGLAAPPVEPQALIRSTGGRHG